MRAILAFMIAILTACAISPARVEAPARAAAKKLESPTKPLSSFAEYDLKPMVFSNAIEGDKGKLEKARELRRSLNDRLLPLLESWHVSGNEDASDSLSIETELINLRVVSGVVRTWTPTVAVGDSHIDINLRLVNTTTGDAIANLEIRTRARRWGSAYTGVSDETLDEYVVAIVYNYLSDNH